MVGQAKRFGTLVLLPSPPTAMLSPALWMALVRSLSVIPQICAVLLLGYGFWRRWDGIDFNINLAYCMF